MPYKDPEKKKAAQRRHYEANKDKFIERSHRQRDKRRQWVRDYKESSGCVDCKEMLPYYVLQFDHLDGETKDKNIASLIHWVGLEKIKQEVAKCEVVCANCHARRTWCRLMKSGKSVGDYTV